MKNLGEAVDETTGAARLIQNLILAASQQPEILREGKPIRPDLLIPVVVDHCRKSNKEFKGLAYAIKIVLSMLDEWARKGMPGDRPAKGNGSPREFKSRTGTLVIGKV